MHGFSLVPLLLKHTTPVPRLSRIVVMTSTFMEVERRGRWKHSESNVKGAAAATLDYWVRLIRKAEKLVRTSVGGNGAGS